MTLVVQEAAQATHSRLLLRLGSTPRPLHPNRLLNTFTRHMPEWLPMYSYLEVCTRRGRRGVRPFITTLSILYPQQLSSPPLFWILFLDSTSRLLMGAGIWSEADVAKRRFTFATPPTHRFIYNVCIDIESIYQPNTWIWTPSSLWHEYKTWKWTTSSIHYMKMPPPRKWLCCLRVTPFCRSIVSQRTLNSTKYMKCQPELWGGTS